MTADDRPGGFSGRVAPGKGIAVGFTSSPWARDGFIRLVGIDPFPGTLNLVVEDGADRAAWVRFKAGPGALRLPAPDPAWCDALLFPVLLNGRQPAAIVLPEVAGYDPGQVEIIAAVRLRDALGLADGDRVHVAARVGAA